VLLDLRNEGVYGASQEEENTVCAEYECILDGEFWLTLDRDDKNIKAYASYKHKCLCNNNV